MKARASPPAETDRFPGPISPPSLLPRAPRPNDHALTRTAPPGDVVPAESRRKRAVRGRPGAIHPSAIPRALLLQQHIAAPRRHARLLPGRREERLHQRPQVRPRLREPLPGDLPRRGPGWQGRGPLLQGRPRRRRGHQAVHEHAPDFRHGPHHVRRPAPGPPELLYGISRRRGAQRRLGLGPEPRGCHLLPVPRAGRLCAAGFPAERLHEPALRKHERPRQGEEHAGSLWKQEAQYCEYTPRVGFSGASVADTVPSTRYRRPGPRKAHMRPTKRTP